MKWRVIQDGIHDAYANMARDASIFEAVSKGESLPTIRIYGWEGSGISIGKNQTIDDIDFKKCEQDGVRIVRRPTGGRAVFHAGPPQADFTYSVIAPNTLFDPDFKPYFSYNEKAYDTICGWIIAALRSAGFNSEMVGKNSVYVGGFKVSGNAQVPGKEELDHVAFLQHGSIWIYTTRWADYIAEKGNLKGLAEINPGFEPAPFMGYLINAFTTNSFVNGDFEVSGLTPSEQTRALELAVHYQETTIGHGEEKSKGSCANHDR